MAAIKEDHQEAGKKEEHFHAEWTRASVDGVKPSLNQQLLYKYSVF